MSGKFLNESRVSELWAKIKEYVDDAAGGGSSEEIYTTEEIRIGTYLGKPLYRKVYADLMLPSVGGTQTLFTVPNDLDEMIDIRGRSWQDGVYMIPLPWTSFNAYGVSLHYVVADRTIVTNVAWSEWRGKPAEITLEYTKTTD